MSDEIHPKPKAKMKDDPNTKFDVKVGNADVRRVNRRVWAVYQNNQERARFSGTDSRRQAIEWATKYAK